MRRRDYLCALSGVAAGWSASARAQQTMPVVGYVRGRSLEYEEQLLSSFRKGLEQEGYAAMRRKFQWVEADATYPFRDEARVLARRQGSIGTVPAREQVLARLATGHAKIVVESSARHLRQLEPDGPASLSLSDIGAINGVAIGCHIIDPERDEIATPQLAVDRQVEQRQVARATLQLQLGPDQPHVPWPQRWL